MSTTNITTTLVNMMMMTGRPGSNGKRKITAWWSDPDAQERKRRVGLRKRKKRRRMRRSIQIG